VTGHRRNTIVVQGGDWDIFLVTGLSLNGDNATVGKRELHRVAMTIGRSLLDFHFCASPLDFLKSA
jgi:hypothetical protein